MPLPETLFLNHVITHRPLVGRDGYGVPQYGGPTTLRCQVNFKDKLVYRRDGSQAFSDTRVYVDTTAGEVIRIEDQVTLPDGTTPPLLRVDRTPDEFGDFVLTTLYF
jgi:hypothetical protein